MRESFYFHLSIFSGETFSVCHFVMVASFAILFQVIQDGVVVPFLRLCAFIKLYVTFRLHFRFQFEISVRVHFVRYRICINMLSVSSNHPHVGFDQRLTHLIHSLNLTKPSSNFTSSRKSFWSTTIRATCAWERSEYRRNKFPRGHGKTVNVVGGKTEIAGGREA